MPMECSDMTKDRTQTTRAVGKAYEDKACAYLKSKGYRILDRNFTKRGGELDIVAKKDDTLVFVEVRYRADNRHGDPLETVTKAKQRRIIQTAQFYLLKKKLPQDRLMRFDVIAITDDNLNHVENAFIL